MPDEDNELVIRAELRNDVTPGARSVRRDIRGISDEAERLERSGLRGARGLDHLDRTGARTRRGMGDLHRSLLSVSGAAGDQLWRASTRGAQALGILTTATAGFGLKAASNLQQGQIQLETLLGSAQEATRVFTFLKQLDPKVPFDVGQLQQMTVQLANANITGNELFRTLQGVSDVAATTADPNLAATRVARAVAQMKSAGVILAEEINQLVDAGVAVGPALEKAYGITLAQFRKQQSQGGAQLAPEPLFAALFGMRIGSAERVATETLAGLWSGVRSRVTLKLADESSPLVQMLMSELPQIEGAVGLLLDQAGPELFGFVGDIIGLLTDALPAAAPVLTAIFGGLGSLLSAAGPGLRALEPLAGEVGDGIADVFRELAPLMPDLVATFGAWLGILPEFLEVGGDVARVLLFIVGGVTDLMGIMPGGERVAATLLWTLLGYRALASMATGLRSFGIALGFIGNQAQTAGVKAQVAYGRFLRLGAGIAGAVGVASGLGGAAQGTNSGLDTLGFIGSGALVGGSIAGPWGAVAGAGVAAGVTGLGMLFGDPVVPGHTMAGHLAAGGGAPGLQITSGMRDWGLRSGASGHLNGSAVDVVGPGLTGYVQRVRDRGGWATIEGAGTGGMHAHALPAGDPAVPSWATNRGATRSGTGRAAVFNNYGTIVGVTDFKRHMRDVIRETELEDVARSRDPIRGRRT